MSTAWYIHRRGDGWIAIEHYQNKDLAGLHTPGTETGKLVGFLTLVETETELRSRGLSPIYPIPPRIEHVMRGVIAVWM